MKIVRAADLFCGAGGTSTGLALACRDLGLQTDLLAVNHWPIAVETHKKNHPWARHLCKSLNEVDPRKEVPGRLNLLVASPECTHHSIARGGVPVNDQLRASAWLFLDWLAKKRPDSALVENVPEFESWGPTYNGRPIKSRKGETFRAWIEACRAENYTVDWRVLNAADHGDPTTRRRLFIMMRRGREKRLAWPAQSHAPAGSLLPDTEPWRTARDHVIDWSLTGESIFNRKRPLSSNTLARIAAGLKKFGGISFILPHRQFDGMQVDSVDQPLRTVTAKGGGDNGLVQPFLINLRGTERSQIHGSARSIDAPLPTTTAGGGHVGVVEPFILGQQSNSAPRSTSQPIPTIATAGKIALVEPFVLPPLGYHARGGKANRPRSVGQPMQTITSRGGGHVVEPFLIPFYGERDGQEPRTHSVDEPVPTIPASGDGKFGVVEPFVMHVTHRGGDRTKSIDAPLSTITTANRGEMGLVEPFLVQYNGTADAQSVDEPMRTVSTRDRFALVEVDGVPMALDIRFRMLQPHELAAAMGFPKDYQFAGNRGDQVRQIGNAVAVNLARALCRALLGAA